MTMSMMWSLFVGAGHDQEYDAHAGHERGEVPGADERTDLTRDRHPKPRHTRTV